MKISVIIPVYRVEHTLRRCVDSILRQDFTDWEMILVDDGSDDASPQICEEYAAKDPRIRTVHQPNRGLGAARNKGMDIARGELIMFMDSDDYIGEGTLGALAAYMDRNEDVDMAEFPFERIRAGGQSELRTFTPHTYTDPIAYFFKEEAYTHSYAWNKIYRRTTLGNVRFVERKKFEDMLTLPRFLKACRKIGMTNVLRICGQSQWHHSKGWQGTGAPAGSSFGDDGYNRMGMSAWHSEKALHQILRTRAEYPDRRLSSCGTQDAPGKTKEIFRNSKACHGGDIGSGKNM